MTGCRIICPKGKHLFLERQADDIFIKQSEFGKGKSKSQVRVSEGLRRISFLLCLKISVSSCLREAPRGRLGLGPPLLSVVLSALSSRPFPLYPPVLCEISSHSRSTSWISSMSLLPCLLPHPLSLGWRTSSLPPCAQHFPLSSTPARPEINNFPTSWRLQTQKHRT